MYLVLSLSLFIASFSVQKGLLNFYLTFQQHCSWGKLAWQEGKQVFLWKIYEVVKQARLVKLLLGGRKQTLQAAYFVCHKRVANS